MYENMIYQDPNFIEITAYVLLVLAYENAQENTFTADITLLSSGPFARFFLLDVEKVLIDRHYIEPHNSSDSEYEITSAGQSFANSYRVQNNIDLDKSPMEIIMSIYNG